MNEAELRSFNFLKLKYIHRRGDQILQLFATNFQTFLMNSIDVFCCENKLTLKIWKSNGFVMDLKIQHKEVGLNINGTQSVRLQKATTEFKNTSLILNLNFKQIPVPFKVYADFEYNLDSVESYEGS